MTTLVFAILLFLNAFVVPPTGAAGDFEVQPVQLGDLRLVHQVGPAFFTGGSPRGDADFESLRAAGIRTVISVDGAKPEVERARVRGIRYVHLPIGYDGVDSSVAVRLARAIRDLPGPIYLHCHHGRHRAPAAAAVGLASLGRLEPSRGVRMLEIVGTSRDYPGLYAAVGGSAPLSKTAIDAIPLGDLPSVATVSDLATGMADVDRIHDRLRLLAANGWVAPADHADLVPAVEAGILTERFRGMSHLSPVTGSVEKSTGSPLDFRRTIDLAMSLEAAVGVGRTADADAILGSISSDCRACHRRHRNGPRPGRD